jgi:hypothetical protein
MMLAMFVGVPGFVALLRMMMRANLFDKAGMSWLVHMTAADHTVSCAQAHRILRFYAAEPLSQRCAIFVSLFPKITDRQSIPALIRENFTVDERAPLRKALGRMYYYSATFPTVRRPVGTSGCACTVDADGRGPWGGPFRWYRGCGWPRRRDTIASCWTCLPTGSSSKSSAAGRSRCRPRSKLRRTRHRHAN